MKISFHVKTNLNYDGRVLASIDAVSKSYPESIVRVALLPNAKTKVKFSNNVYVEEITIKMREWKYKSRLRALIVLLYTLKDLLGLIRFKPEVIHAHDSTSYFAPFLYKILKRGRVKLIYDDHEVFNRPTSIVERISIWFEGVVARTSDKVVVANSSRSRIIKKVFNLKSRPVVISNYFYKRGEEMEVFEIDKVTREQLKKLDDLGSRGYKFLLHQGSILPGRGQVLLEAIPGFLNEKWMLCSIGVEHEKFNELKRLSNANNTFTLGKVKFDFLPEVYKKMNAAIIFYKGDKLNNRYCAPNRLYQAVAHGLPVIVNEDTPEL